MNDVDFEKVRSLFENDDKEGLLVFSGEYFKKINSAQFVSTCDLLARMQENCLGRNYQAEMLIPRHLLADCIYFSHRGVEDIFLPAKLSPPGIRCIYPLPWNFLGIHCQIPLENGFNRRPSSGFWSLITPTPWISAVFFHPSPWIFQGFFYTPPLDFPVSSTLPPPLCG